MPKVNLDKIDELETVDGVTIFIVETKEEIKAFDVIGNVVNVDDVPYFCLAIDKINGEDMDDVGEDMVLWAGEKFKLYGSPHPWDHQDEEGDDFW